jgi:putative ABC transport system permease protein
VDLATFGRRSHGLQTRVTGRATRHSISAVGLTFRLFTMNLFQLILKQMRQRSLGTWLTILSVMLGTTLATGILLLRRGTESLFVQKDYGYDLIVGSGRGSPLQLVLNTAYQIDKSPGNLPYWVYEQLADTRRGLGGPQFDFRAHVALAVPFARGDTYKSRPIIATTPRMFGFDDDLNPVPLYKEENGKPTSELSNGVFQYRPGERFELATGRVFHPKKFEAVIGAEVAAKLGTKVGDKFHPTHGASKDVGEKAGPEEHVHGEEWQVVGILKPTGTANDRCVYIPLISFYCIDEHEEGLEAQSAAQKGMRATKKLQPATGPHEEPYDLNKDGTIALKVPSEKWQISGVFVKSRGGVTPTNLLYHINNGGIADAVAVNPAETMRSFFQTFLGPSSQVLLLISMLVSVLAAVSILVSIYNSVSARNKEIAILRALGATRNKVLLLICLEAGLIGVVGGLFGWAGGHLIGAAASQQLERQFGQGFKWWSVDSGEVAYLVAVVVIAVLAGLVPALKAYRTPVATNLVAS